MENLYNLYNLGWDFWDAAGGDLPAKFLIYEKAIDLATPGSTMSVISPGALKSSLKSFYQASFRCSYLGKDSVRVKKFITLTI